MQDQMTPPQVANPHGKLIYTTREKTEDKFSFKARYAGRYHFCLTLSAHNSLSVALRTTHRRAVCTLRSHVAML